MVGFIGRDRELAMRLRKSACAVGKAMDLPALAADQLRERRVCGSQ